MASERWGVNIGKGLGGEAAWEAAGGREGVGASRRATGRREGT